MDAKERNLALLAALSLSCAGFAWIVDHPVFSSVFFVLGELRLSAWLRVTGDDFHQDSIPPLQCPALPLARPLARLNWSGHALPQRDGFASPARPWTVRGCVPASSEA
jgi:hypothetical protein